MHKVLKKYVPPLIIHDSNVEKKTQLTQIKLKN